MSRTTAQERADAADRWVDAEEDAYRAVEDMAAIVRERRSAGQLGSGPLFPFIGDKILNLLGQVTDALYEAHKLVAVQAYDERRKIEQAEQAEDET